MSKRTPTTKDVGLLNQLFKDGQLKLAPEFQRNSVWPKAAKAYLIDTILTDRPIPILFFARSTSPQTGRPEFSVIDGQQRLRAIFEFLDDGFRLTQSKGKPYFNKRFEGLSADLKNQVRNYDLVVEELSGYSETDIKDMFVRMNKYVVKLSRQELLHAKSQGKFKEFVEDLGALDFWRERKVFSATQLLRMRAVEFAAEITILLIEGPQDKKSAVGLYYGEYRTSFPESATIKTLLRRYLQWIETALPHLERTRFRSPVELYSLIGALDKVTNHGKRLSKLDPLSVSRRLLNFERRSKERELGGEAYRYVMAASRQTDNVGPRSTRIDILSSLLI